jgi:hypothetical protein
MPAPDAEWWPLKFRLARPDEAFERIAEVYGPGMKLIRVIKWDGLGGHDYEVLVNTYDGIYLHYEHDLPDLISVRASLLGYFNPQE